METEAAQDKIIINEVVSMQSSGRKTGSLHSNYSEVEQDEYQEDLIQLTAQQASLDHSQKVSDQGFTTLNVRNF